MSKGLYVTVKVPAGQFEIDNSGLTYVPEEAGDTAWVLSLEKAEEVFNAVARSVHVLLEVEPGREASDWRTTRGTDPSPQPSPAPSLQIPYCPFCHTPTCKCWMLHVCR